jgi:dCMP deaminase
VHAEQNAIIQAAKLGVSVDGATLYCTHQPCVICAKMIINAGIKRVVYKYGYPDEFSMSLFKQAEVTVEKYEA